MVFVTRREATAMVLSLLLPIAVGIVGAIFTSEAIPTWYATIEKPPSWFFAPIWTFLYVTMGISAWLVWRSDRGQAVGAERRTMTALLVYAAQLGMNAAWSPMFFGAKRIDLAMAVIAALLVLIVVTIYLFRQVNRLAGLLLVPYLSWVTFATALNATIWQLNR